MRKSTLLAAGAAVVSALILGGGVTLALSGGSAPTVNGAAVRTIAIEEVKSTLGLNNAQVIQLDAPTKEAAEFGFDIAVSIDGVVTTLALEPASVRAAS